MIVETEKLVDKRTIAMMCEVGYPAVHNWISRDIGFPNPIVTICGRDFWDQDEVWTWWYDRVINEDTRRREKIKEHQAAIERLRDDGEY